MPFRPDGTVALVLLGIALINGIVKVLTAWIALKAISLKEGPCVRHDLSSGSLDSPDAVRLP